MSEQWTISWAWWITAVEVPVLGCLFWMIHYGRREAEQALLKVYREIQGNLNVVLENLAQSKLEVARLYATIGDLVDKERLPRAFGLFYTLGSLCGIAAPLGYGFLGDIAGVENAIATIGIAVLLTLPLCLALRPAVGISKPVSI